jgi:hypothetical protein
MLRELSCPIFVSVRTSRRRHRTSPRDCRLNYEDRVRRPNGNGIRLHFGPGTGEIGSMKRGHQAAISGRSKSKKLKRSKKRIAFASIAQRYTELLSLRKRLSEVESLRAAL